MSAQRRATGSVPALPAEAIAEPRHAPPGFHAVGTVFRRSGTLRLCASAAIVLLLALGRGPVAAEPIDRGRLIATGGGPGGVSDACITCHGADGGGDGASGTPALAALSPTYQTKQLDDFATGSRESAVMGPIARRLAPADRVAVSLYLAGLAAATPRLRADGPDPALVQHGGSLWAAGSVPRGIQACADCHGSHGRDPADGVPDIAGQHASYVAAQLHAWREGARTNDPTGTMAEIAKRMSQADIEGVASYASLLPRAARRP